MISLEGCDFMLSMNDIRSSEVVLAVYLSETGWDLRKFDIASESLICDTNRNGRTDEEIDRDARTARVAIIVVLSTLIGCPVCPKFRYKIIEK